MKSNIRTILAVCCVVVLVGTCIAQTGTVPQTGAVQGVSPQPVSPTVPGVAPVAGNSTAAPAATEASPSAQTPIGDMAGMKIGPGDLVRITIFGDPDYRPEIRLDSDGNADIQPLGRVHLGGLTPSEASEMLGKRLLERGLYRDPHVSVAILDYATQGVSVLGEVQKPGVYIIQGERHLFDVISAANGFTPRAGTKVSITHRNQPNKPIVMNVSHDPAASPDSNVVIYPGDTVLVSSAGVIYVVGDVAKPSGFVMDNENLTMLQAVALAGGVNSTAALNDVKIIRKTAEGRKELPVRFNDVLQSKGEDLALKPDDILFVPKSAGKNAAQRGMAAILQAATGVAIYSTHR